MSILPSKSESTVGHRSTGPLPTNSNDAVLRATGVLSLLAIGTIHFLQIVPTTEATPLLGVSFLILIAACLAVAGRLANHNDHRTWTASAVVCAAAIGGYPVYPHLQYPPRQPGRGQLVVHAGPGCPVRRDHPVGVQRLCRPHAESSPDRGQAGPDNRRVPRIVPGTSRAA